MTPAEEDALYEEFDNDRHSVIGTRGAFLVAIRAAVARERERAELDAQCFRFWVREAANSPGDMARLIAHCVTEDDYRRAICPIATSAESAIKAAAIRRGE